MNLPTPQSGEPRPDPSLPPGSVRASDAEREAVVEWLRIASVEGRLTFAELAERTEAAYGAATRGELERITADLPGVGAPGAEPAPRLESRRFTAVLGDIRERIVGRVEEELHLLSVLGDIVLDLRDAQVPRCEVTIVATAVLGDITIIVPDGVEVRMTGHSVLGDRSVRTRGSESGPAAPVVHVRAESVLGDIKIVDSEHGGGTVRRTFEAWRERRRSRP